MRVFRVFLSALVLVAVHNSAIAQQSETQKNLIGSWIYFGLEDGDTGGVLSKEEHEKADRLNKGLIVTFKTDGKYEIWKKMNDKKNVLASGQTKLLNHGKHLKIEGLEGDIYALDKSFLKLIAEGRPIMVFKKYLEQIK